MKAGGANGREIADGRKELLRGKVMEMAKRGELTIKTAAKELKVNYRQGLRIYAAYREGGGAALIHGNTGKESGRKADAAVREAALKAYREKHNDFGPTFAAGKPAEAEGISISEDTLRRWLIAEGLWVGRRGRKDHRSRRERRACFGEPAQFDGSHHRRFEKRGMACCLITMIDDAANIRRAQFFWWRDDRRRDDCIVILDKDLRDTASPVPRS
jgi:transposase